MKNQILSAITVFASLALISCGKSKNSDVSQIPGLSAGNAQLTVTQNGSVTMDLGSLGARNGLTITRAPMFGRIRVAGSKVTYRSTNPLYSGEDSFGYRFTSGGVTSTEGNVAVNITPLASGTTTYTENFAGQAFALQGWRSYGSTVGHTSSSLVEFRRGSYNGAASDVRRYKVYGDIASYAGDTTYMSLFASLPIDGSGFQMHDWPWKADLLHVPECGVDATVTVKIQPVNGEYPMAAILLNYDIDRNAANTAQELTGYQLLVNTGGGSLTLSRFNQAHELATAYLDRWPNTNYGTEALKNPVVSGPYKGWNYRNGAWPAGGNIGAGGAKFVAVRYQYDVTTGGTTISFEARPASGVDATPGVWDIVVNLTGTDSLTPGGSFGIMPMNYHTSSMLLTTDFEVSEFKLQCVLP
jgi:hypothetical protein